MPAKLLPLVFIVYLTCVRATNLIEVEPQSYITSPSTLQRVPINSPVEVICEALSVPMPTVYWLKDGRRFRRNVFTNDVPTVEFNNNASCCSNIQYIKTVTRLHVPCSNSSVIYRCVFETPFTTVSQDHQVQIISNPTSSENETCPSPVSRARIHLFTIFALDYLGKSIQLYCRALRGSTITWFDQHDNAIVNGQNGYNITAKGDLIVSGQDMVRHAGQYRCQAVNRHGEDSVRSFIYYVERPPSPRVMTLTRATN